MVELRLSEDSAVLHAVRKLPRQNLLCDRLSQPTAEAHAEAELAMLAECDFHVFFARATL